jgi:hypothetical protein
MDKKAVKTQGERSVTEDNSQPSKVVSTPHEGARKIQQTDNKPSVKKKFSVYGNCQADPLGSILRTNSEFNEQWEFVQFPKPSFALRPNDWEQIEKLMSELDLFITQNVGDSHGIFASDNLIKQMKPDADVLRIPNAYFSGYMPEVVYFRAGEPHVTKFCDYHDENFLALFMKDPVHAVESAVRAAQSEDTYSIEFVKNNAEKSIEELQRREEACDVTVSDYIAENWQNDILFYSMNHPKRKVLAHIASQILVKLEQKTTTLSGDYEHLSNTRLPVYQSVRKLLTKDVEWNLSVANQQIELEDYYKGHARVLRSIEPEFLRKAYRKFKQTRLPSS